MLDMEKIRTLYRRKGLRQKDLAEALNISVSSDKGDLGAVQVHVKVTF